MSINKDEYENIKNQTAWVNLSGYEQRLVNFNPNGKYTIDSYSFIELTKHNLNIPKEVHKVSETKYFASNEREIKEFWLLTWGGSTGGYGTTKGLNAKSMWFPNLQEAIEAITGSLEKGELI